MQPVIYLAIDPGDTTGWATFNELGNLTAYGQIAEKDFNRWLSDTLDAHPLLETVICENYLNTVHNIKIHVHKRNRSNKTSKKIGAIEALCDLKGITVILQPNTVKSIGYGWSGFEQPSNHIISHQFDAVAHGVYYLVQNGVRNVADILKNML